MKSDVCRHCYSTLCHEVGCVNVMLSAMCVDVALCHEV